MPVAQAGPQCSILAPGWCWSWWGHLARTVPAHSPPSTPSKIAQLPPPRQLPAASSLLPTADPGEGRGAGNSNPPPAPPSPHSTDSEAMPATVTPTHTVQLMRPRPALHQGEGNGPMAPQRSRHGQPLWSPSLVHGAVPKAHMMSTSHQLPCATQAGHKSLFPSLPWPCSGASCPPLLWLQVLCPDGCPWEGNQSKIAGVPLYPTNVRQYSHTLHSAGVQCRQCLAPTCPEPSAWRQDPLTNYPLQLLPMGPGDMTETAGQSGACSATKAAGRGQSLPDLLLLPHHLLSFSLTLAGPLPAHGSIKSCH